MTTTLRNQVATGRVGHAYLFTGSRGCGKTTSARIFAREVNTAGLDSSNPHSKRIADAIAEGRSLDIIEIDAASHTSVDDIRELRDKVAFQPGELRYKVYIIDEVHMLSTSAFNALLKTLEEPPPHVVFILATTDPQKIPATVLSRCQRFNFRRVPIKLIVQRLRKLCEGEAIEADEHALTLMARHAGGALRDAESLLDQLSSSNSMRITASDVRDLLGATDNATLRRLVDGLITRDMPGGLEAIQSMIDQGGDARQTARQMVDMLRNVMQIKFGATAKNKPAEMSEAELVELGELAERISTPALLRGIRAFSGAIADMRNNTDTQLALEMAYLECLAPEDKSDRVEKGERDDKADKTTQLRAASDQRPTTSNQQPATNNQRPATSNQQPATSNQQPATNNQRPATSNQQPATSDQQPATSDQQAPAGSDPVHTLKAEWKQIVAAVNKLNKPAAAVLRSCSPYDVRNDVALLKADHSFARDRIEDPKNKAAVVSAINQILGGKFSVQVFTGEPETPPDPDEDPVLQAAKRLGGVVR